LLGRDKYNVSCEETMHDPLPYLEVVLHKSFFIFRHRNSDLAVRACFYDSDVGYKKNNTSSSAEAGPDWEFAWPKATTKMNPII
jgi:hypothetical protein